MAKKASVLKHLAEHSSETGMHKSIKTARFSERFLPPIKRTKCHK
uniref:Uncharacterized protein n=1 Tax=Rhizophora mucronata TaxID=61149 RepID=A0A2P2MZJ6_RHIMU